MDFSKYTNVHVADPKVFKEKLAKITNDGLGKLMFASDFDYTLTRHKDDSGNVCQSTKDLVNDFVIHQNPTLANAYKQMNDKYRPIENSPFKSVREKVPAIEEWYGKSHDFVKKSGISKEAINEKVVHQPLTGGLYLRNYVPEFLKEVSSYNVPYVIFSKGIGDVITSVLEHNLGQKLPSNVHLVSNMIDFDENGTCVGFSKPIIHTFNRNFETARAHADIKNAVEGRQNVILIGNSVLDAHTDLGLPEEKVALKIGYLNKNDDRKLVKYLDVYDIVIVEASSIDLPRKIFEHILEAKH